MRLTVVGCAAAWARSPGRPSSSYLVEGGGTSILLDLGQGALGALHAHCDPADLRAVVISHLHPDHHVDLVALRHLLRFGYATPQQVELHAPSGLRARYDAFLGEVGFLDGLPGADLDAGTRLLGALRLEAAPVTHAAPAFALRVSPAGTEESTGLVYSGDCGRWQDLLALVRPGDTLLCEAFWGNTVADPAAQHLTAAEAAMAAREGRAARLLLTHIEEHHDPEGSLSVAREIAGADVVLASPGLVVAWDDGSDQPPTRSEP